MRLSSARISDTQRAEEAFAGEAPAAEGCPVNACTTVAPISAKLLRVPRSTGPPALPGRVGEQRNVFARVVGAPIGRVVAVIGGEQDQIARAQAPLELGHEAVELLERAREPLHVAAVAVEHVEVDQVAEDESPARGIGGLFEQHAQAVGVARRIDV